MRAAHHWPLATHQLAAYLLCLSAVNVFPASAGDLNPPPGPIAPTHKTLTQVEPRIPVGPTTTPGNAFNTFVIPNRGSYYLTANVIGEPGKNGITLGSDVTLDLNGFTLVGVPGSGHAVATNSVFVNNTVVRNGTIFNWDGAGINAFFDNGAVEDLKVLRCLGGGINATGAFHTRISRCSVIASGTAATAPFGIIGGFSSVIEQCAAREITGDGIVSGTSGIVRDCIASDCSLSGFRVLAGTVTERCTSIDNELHGFLVNNTSTVQECTATANTGDGFNVSSASIVEGCVAASNSHGIFATNSNTLRNNNITSNTTAGLRCANDCLVIDNHFDSNGPLGILVESSDCRITRNTVSDSTVGIRVTVAGNIITGNTVAGATTAWDIAAGNVCLAVSATTAPAFSGSAGGAAPGSTDPNANFTY